MKMKRAYVLIVLVAFTVTVMVSGIYAQPEERISLSTGTTSGMYYIVGTGLGEIAKKYEGLDVEVQTSAGSSENFNLLTRKEIDMGLVGCDAFFSLVFEKKRDISMMSLVMYGFSSPRQFVVRKDSGLRTVKDLKGKRISVGGPGSGCALITKDVLEIGWDITDKNTDMKYFTYGEAISAIRDGVIDAGMVALAVPSACVIDLSTSFPVWILEWDRGKIKKITANPKYQFYFDYTLTAGTYRGLDKDVTVLSSPPCLILCRADLSEDAVYRFVKAVWEHNKNLVAIHPAGREITLENTLKLWKTKQGKVTGEYIDFHPGVKKYLKEKGVKIQ